MKVKELIEALKTMPQDLDIYCEDPIEGHLICINNVEFMPEGACAGNLCVKCVKCEMYAPINAIKFTW